MKIYYNGREIPEEYAKMLEDNGQAHFGDFVSSIGTEPRMIMESGPGNCWLERQPPERFLSHVLGHTCTWREMAQKWADDDEYGMTVVATMLDNLNYWLLQALQERRERAELTKQG